MGGENRDRSVRSTLLAPTLLLKLVAQICPRWNRLADWLRAAEGYAAAA